VQLVLGDVYRIEGAEGQYKHELESDLVLVWLLAAFRIPVVPSHAVY